MQTRQMTRQQMQPKEMEPHRHGYDWSISEILKLQREYELLELSIDEIAQIHQRSPKSIMCKLAQEGFASLSKLTSDYEK